MPLAHFSFIFHFVSKPQENIIKKPLLNRNDVNNEKEIEATQIKQRCKGATTINADKTYNP